MTTSTMLILIILTLVLLTLIVFIHSHIKEQRKTIERQHDTIQKLINREPVTYQETGEKQPKQSKEAYAAWGNQTVEINEDESR